MLNPIQELYAQARVKGLSKEMAAIAAGFDYDFATMHGETLEANEEIREYLKRYIARKISDFEIVDRLDPKEYLETLLNLPTTDPEVKINIAFKLLPYTQKKERATPAGPKKTKKEQQEEALVKTEQGQFGQGKAPSPLRSVN